MLYIPPRKDFSMDVLTAGLKYIKAGIAPIPVWNDERKNPKLTTILKYTKRLPTPSQWRKWCRGLQPFNVGLITGYWGYVALDFDDKASYEVYGRYRGQTWTVRTARGYHVWFKVTDVDPGPSRNYVNGLGQSFLLRAKGGYCISPPSMHHTGVRYRTVHRVAPLGLSLSEIVYGWVEKQPKRPVRTSPIKPLELYRTTGGRLRLEELVSPVGEINGRGAYQCFCPFHDDTKPSAWINIGQQRFGCNACWPGCWFDVVNVYAKLNNLDNGEAFRRLTSGKAR